MVYVRIDFQRDRIDLVACKLAAWRRRCSVFGGTDQDQKRVLAEGVVTLPVSVFLCLVAKRCARSHDGGPARAHPGLRQSLGTADGGDH